MNVSFKLPFIGRKARDFRRAFVQLFTFCHNECNFFHLTSFEIETIYAFPSLNWFELFFFLLFFIGTDDGGYNSQNRNQGNNSNYQQNRQMGYQNNFNNYQSHGNQSYHRQNQQTHFQQVNRNNPNNRFQPYQQRSNNNFGQNQGGFNRNQQSNRGGGNNQGGYWR